MGTPPLLVAYQIIMKLTIPDWLVVWLPSIKFPMTIGFLIIPIDELIFFRGVQTTNQQNLLYRNLLLLTFEKIQQIFLVHSIMVIHSFCLQISVVGDIFLDVDHFAFLEASCPDQ